MAILVRPPVQSAHWYSANGEPVHTRPTAEGNPRPTTLADARKLGLYPSVSGILNIMSKQGLEKWKIKQVMLAMNGNPQAKTEPTEPYYDRILEIAFSQVKVAGDAGTGLHDAIMCALQGRSFPEHFQIYVDAMFKWLEQAEIVPRMTEQTLVNQEFGFAGTMDFAGMRSGCIPMVLDWKTRRTKPGQPITSYESSPMQIAAYGATYWASEWPNVIGGNIYFSSTEPGRIEMIPYDYRRMREEFEAFKNCLSLWQHLNGYDPRLASSAAQGTGPAYLNEPRPNVVIHAPDPAWPLLTDLVAKDAPASPKVTTSKPKQKSVAERIAEVKEFAEAPSPVAGLKETAEKIVKATKPKKKVKTAPEPFEFDGDNRGTPPPKKRAVQSVKAGPQLAVIPFGANKGIAVHNVPVEELEKCLKFNKQHLAKHPGLEFSIRRFLEARGQKATKGARA